MLLGIDLDIYDIGAINEGDYYVKFYLCNKNDYFKWALVAVYGSTQAQHKEQFLIELVNLCSHEQLPILIGGDSNYEHRWPFLFNSVIDNLNLRELEMS
jgi:hypothetical protein